MKNFLNIFSLLKYDHTPAMGTLTPSELLNCNPFVMEDDDTIGTSPTLTDEESISVMRLAVEQVGEIVDAPFNLFSIESNINDRIYGCLTFGDGSVCGVTCIVVRELSPKVFDLHIVFSFHSENTVRLKFLPLDGLAYYLNKLNIEPSQLDRVAKEVAGLVKLRVDEFMKQLTKSSLGHVPCREIIKYRKPNGEKAKHIFSNTIYIGKKSTASPVTFMGRNVDWSYRFSVRGHWRKNEGKLGKDRAGNYCVENFTWVSEHLRGPDDAPVVMKQRILK